MELDDCFEGGEAGRGLGLVVEVGGVLLVMHRSGCDVTATLRADLLLRLRPIVDY